MSNQRSFTPQIQYSDGQFDSEHFDEESKDYLPSTACENLSEDDSESTDDGFDRFTNHQIHLSTSRQWLCLSCMTSGAFFLQLVEIISVAKLFIIVHFFVLKHEKQTLATFTQNVKVIKTRFFSPINFVGAPVFLPKHWKLLGPERLMPLYLIGMNMVNKRSERFLMSLCYQTGLHHAWDLGCGGWCEWRERCCVHAAQE